MTRARFGIGRFDDEEAVLVAYDSHTVAQSLDADFVAGNFNGLRGNGLLVDAAVLKSRDWRLGDTVRLMMQNGQERALRIGGAFKRNNALGTYLISTRTYTDMGGAPMDRYVYVNLSPGAGAATRDAVEKITAAYPVVDLKDPAQFQEQERGQVDQLLMMVNALLVLSVLIAVLGVVNTLALSVIERTREFGLLRAVGMRRRDVRRMVRWESVVISLYGAVAGLVIGVLFGVGVTGALRSQGIEQVAVPVVQLAAFLAMGGAIGVVAAILPARRAARLQVLEAIAAQ